jgi:hypothetical protein
MGFVSAAVLLICTLGLSQEVDPRVPVFGIDDVQPVCTEKDFQKALGTSILGDHEFIARAVFDDYIDRIKLIASEGSVEPNSKTYTIDYQHKQTKQADELLDELLESLQVLSNDEKWKMGIVELRRTVLLGSRNSNNPWPSTVWVDVTEIVDIPNSAHLAINDFLISNFDSDVEDRFGAIRAKVLGDEALCKSYEKRAMNRWASYSKIIQPFLNKDIEQAMYPQIKQSNDVKNTLEWIVQHVDDRGTIDKANLLFAVWKTTFSKLKQESISIINNSRRRFGFDPWSKGCGTNDSSQKSRAKNQLLKKTATMQEATEKTVRDLLNLLSQDQRHLFDSEQ